jgi:hypothetical protein
MTSPYALHILSAYSNKSHEYGGAILDYRGLYQGHS